MTIKKCENEGCDNMQRIQKPDFYLKERNNKMISRCKLCKVVESDDILDAATLAKKLLAQSFNCNIPFLNNRNLSVQRQGL